MSWDRVATSTSEVPPLARIFDKFGDILTRQWNESRDIMKVPHNPPMVWSRHPRMAQESDAHQAPLNSVLYVSGEEEERVSACERLVERLEQALREAKLLHLHCGEVLLPHDLFWRIADQVIEASDHEPCGLRGCLIYIHLQDAQKLERRRVGAIRCGDPGTVATFEIHLTLFQDADSWFNLRHLIPDKLLQSLGRRSSLVVSSHFLLDKKKLYRSSQ